jgi:hypothetical protein
MASTMPGWMNVHRAEELPFSLVSTEGPPIATENTMTTILVLFDHTQEEEKKLTNLQGKDEAREGFM